MWRDKKGMDEFSAYRGLAAGVIDQALADFHARIPRHNVNNPDKIGRLRYRLIQVNKSIDAGRFLFDRDDDLARLWAGWLDCRDVAAMRYMLTKAAPRWRMRMAALEGAAAAIVREIKRLERIPQRRKQEAMTA